MSQISLTASMRSNLLSLQGTADLMSQTQTRLASGKKVNSAIDNPSSYYTAQSLSNRAGDLSGLLDSMGQAISTIKAANEGITSITSFVEQAKAVATSALDTTDVSSRASYGSQFNAILDQINEMASDSGYKGINLLKEDKLTVTFNEGRTNKLEIQGVDASTGTDGLNIGKVEWDATKEADYESALTSYKAAAGSAASEEAANTYVKTAQDAKSAYEEASAGGITQATAPVALTPDSDSKVTAPTGGIIKGQIIQNATDNKYYQAKDTFAEGSKPVLTTDFNQVYKGDDGKYYTSTEAQTAANSAFTAYKAATGTSTTVTDADDAVKALIDAKDTFDKAKAAAIDVANKAIASAIQDSIEEATKAINKLRDYASDFGNNYAIVQTREEFTTNLINVLEEGADKLTLADMNEESANMLALQTRQQLAINSLSLASQASQSVLRLFS